MKRSHSESSDISLYFYPVMLFLQDLCNEFPLNLIIETIHVMADTGIDPNI